MTDRTNDTGAARGKVLTANVLTDGVVVYWNVGGGWTEGLAKARFLTDKDEQDRLLHDAEQDVERLVIVDPYLMDAANGPDGPEPVSQRERIRATGPTIPTNFNPPIPEG
jgi:hypothetical protein